MDNTALLFIAEIVGFIGGALGMVQGIPQTWRIYRLGTGYGVSLSSWLLMLYRVAAWMGYGFLIASPSVIVSNMVACVTSAMVCVALLKMRHFAWLWLIPTAALAAYLIVLFPAWVTWIVLLVFTLARLPQLLVSIQNMRRGKTTAVSISAIVLGASSMACWAFYGFVHQDSIVLWTTGLAFVLMIATGALEVYTNKKAIAVQARLEGEATI